MGANPSWGAGTPRLLGILLVAALTGCVGPVQPFDSLREQVERSLVPVVDAENQARGLAVVVRATNERVVLALGNPPPDVHTLYLTFGEERVPAQVQLAGKLALLEAPRGGRDLRAVQLAKRPQIGELAFVYAAPPNTGVVRSLTSVSQVSPLRLHSLAAPFGDADDAGGLGDAPGGLVFAPGGRLIGLIADDPSGEQPEVRTLLDMAPTLLARLEVPGAELMGPDDGFLTYLLDVRSKLEPDELPLIADDWGEPDFFLVLEREDLRIARVEITPQRREFEPQLVWLPARRGLTARLVERDLSLSGERETNLAESLTVEAKPSLVYSFSILAQVIESYPKGTVGPEQTRLTVAFEEVDPERTSSADRTPVGARKHGLNRVASGTLDWWGGDATDFWTIDVEQGGEVLCFLYRERPDAQITLQAFLPGVGLPLFATDPTIDRRLLVAKATVPAGQLLMRVRQVGGPRSPSGYSLFLFPPAEGPELLFRTLFRLLGRQSPSSFPFLASKEFARQVQLTLAAESGLDPQALALAALAGLGDRMSAARHLVLHLLNVHFPPSLTQLESVHRKAVAADRQRGARALGRRARDAALLLAQRCEPHDRGRGRLRVKQRSFEEYVQLLLLQRSLEPGVLDPAPPVNDTALISQIRLQARNTLHMAILDAAREVSDPSIRLRALSAASRWEEPELKREMRRELRQILQNDPSPMVRRALERAFPPEVEERQRRLRQRASRRLPR